MGTCQVVGVQVAVHAHMGATRGQVADDSPRAGPEVGKGVLCIDAALDGVPLQAALDPLYMLAGCAMLACNIASLDSSGHTEPLKLSVLNHTDVAQDI